VHWALKHKSQRMLAGGMSVMTEALKHGSRRDRRAAAIALGMSNCPDAFEPLVEALELTYGEDEDLAILIVQALGELRDARAVLPLQTLLADRRDDAFYFVAHREALIALARLGALDPVREFALDESRDGSLRAEAEGLLNVHP
jgi:HEAT repeat protein